MRWPLSWLTIDITLPLSAEPKLKWMRCVDQRGAYLKKRCMRHPVRHGPDAVVANVAKHAMRFYRREDACPFTVDAHAVRNVSQTSDSDVCATPPVPLVSFWCQRLPYWS